MGFFDLFKKKETSDGEIQPGANDDEIVYPEILPVEIPERTLREINKLNSLGGFASKFADAYLESKRINANIKVLRTTTSAVVSMHAAQLTHARECLTMVFAERSTALNKHYDVLERALKSNDRELILASLQGISSIVVANPLDKVGEYIKALNDPKAPLELDF